MVNGLGVSFFLFATLVIDIVLKIIVRQLPMVVGRFSFETPLGLIGFAPSVNTTLAFSLPVPNAAVWPMGWLVVGLLLWQIPRAHPPMRLVIAAIILGAFSNLIDRTFLGGVTDYLSCTDLFPAFNIADLLIIGGVVGWIVMKRTERPLARGIESSK